MNKGNSEQIESSIKLLKSVLGDRLLGMYLYGSAVSGGLQRYSDLDLFVISETHTTLEEKEKIAIGLLEISGTYGVSIDKRSVELIIVVQSELNPWKTPPLFDFQYGEWLRPSFESGDFEPWASKEMPDLAMLVSQVLQASKTLDGAPSKNLLAPVPTLDLMDAQTRELDKLYADLESDTRNILLTFARIWYTVETGNIDSKEAAASWAIERLPTDYQSVLVHAREVYLGEREENWNLFPELITPCADFMIGKIKQKTNKAL